MSLSDVSDLFLTWVVTYGASMLGLALLLGALGIPLPGTLFVLAAGAFVRQEVLEGYSAFGLALLGASVGDVASYGVGRFARGWLNGRFGQTKTWQQAEQSFSQRGGVAIYLTRWLLTPIAIPTDWIAGSSGYPLRRFLLYGISGEATWLLLYGGLGYWFGSEWEAISQFISDFSGVLLGVVALLAGSYFWLSRSAEPELEAERPLVID